MGYPSVIRDNCAFHWFVYYGFPVPIPSPLLWLTAISR